MLLGLRHDVDTAIGGLKGIPKIMKIEDKYDARSSFFIRVKLLKNKNLLFLLRQAEIDGWEIGLHLDNTLNPSEAKKELETLRSYGFDVRGVTPHGGLYGFNPDITWKVIERLDVYYAQTGQLPSKKNSVSKKVLPPHITIDWYIRKYGSKGYTYLKKMIEQHLSRQTGILVVSSHPEFFVFSVGIIGTMDPRIKGFRTKLYKNIAKIIMISLSPLRIRLVSDYYEGIIEEFSRKARLVTLFEIAKVL